MNRQQAQHLAEFIEQFNSPSFYNVETIQKNGQTLQDFHQWANGKPLVAGFFVTKPGEESYYLLLIDWHRNDTYYLVIYMHDKSTTVCEIRQLTEHEGVNAFVWKYNPLKRDGKNGIRKAYFQKMLGTTSVQIPLPQSPENVEGFFDNIFSLCSNRIRADRSPQLFE